LHFANCILIKTAILRPFNLPKQKYQSLCQKNLTFFISEIRVYRWQGNFNKGENLYSSKKKQPEKICSYFFSSAARFGY